MQHLGGKEEKVADRVLWCGVFLLIKLDHNAKERVNFLEGVSRSPLTTLNRDRNEKPDQKERKRIREGKTTGSGSLSRSRDPLSAFHPLIWFDRVSGPPVTLQSLVLCCFVWLASPITDT